MKGKQSFNSLDVLYIELTNNCNFNCIHCGNENGKSKDLGFGIVKKLLEEFNESNGKKLILTGGEPLLHQKIEDILSLTSSHGYNTKLSTNAYLLNYPEFDFVLDHNLGFRLSLDGTCEVHNEIRNSSKAYNSMISAMKKISKKGRQIIIRTTVMRKNKDCIVDMLSELDRLTKEEDIKVYSINIWPIRCIGKADTNLTLTSKEYKHFLENLNEGTRSLKPLFRIIAGPTFGMELEFKGGPIQSNEIYTCDILNTSLHIAYNGDAYPCSFIHYPLGNVSETSIKDVFLSEKALEFKQKLLDKCNHGCERCDYYTTCKAGCIAETYQELFKLEGKKVKDVYCFRESE